MRNLHHSVVPMSVHQIIGSISVSLAEVLVAVRRSLHVALYVTYVDELALVRRKLELADSCWNIADLSETGNLPSILAMSDVCSPDLTTHKKGQALATVDPACIRKTLT